MAHSKLDDLRQRFAQIAPLDDIEQSPVPDIEWPPDAIGKLDRGEDIDDEEVLALEAIILPQLRPTLPVIRGSVETPEDPWREPFLASKDVLEKAIAAAGRIEAKAAGYPYVGTGFLVGPDLIMTARHVAEAFCVGVGQDDVGIRPGRFADIDFGDGTEDADSRKFAIVEVVMIHPHFDMALLRLEESVDDIAPLILDAHEPPFGTRIAVIAYPTLDPRDDIAKQARVFDNAYGIKRVMLGRVQEPQLVSDDYEQQMLVLAHDALTLSGHSGAPVVDLATGHVLGLSFASRYLEENWAVPCSELLRDARVLDAGVTAIGAAPDDSISWEDAWDKADPSSVVEKGAKTTETATRRKERVGIQGRSALAEFVQEKFRTSEDFRGFLEANGYATVAYVVPQEASAGAFIAALDRREALDATFFEALGETTGADLSMIASSLGIDLAKEPAEDVEQHVWLPPRMLQNIVSADIKGDDALFLGSRYYEQFVDENGEIRGISDIVQRLATDPRREAADALAWLLGRLSDVPGSIGEEAKSDIVEARHFLAGEEEDPAAIASPRLEPQSMQDIDFLLAGAAASAAVGLVSLADDPRGRAVASTGWLLTPSLLVVPGHILSTRDPKTGRYSDEHATQRARAASVRFDFDAADQEGVNVDVESLAFNDPGLDIAILRLAEPVTDRRPLSVTPDIPQDDNTSISLIHHPHAGLKKLSLGGRLLRHDGHEVLYMAETMAGSGGAPVFDDDWQVLATHRAFQFYRPSLDRDPIRAKLGTATGALLQRLRQAFGLASDEWLEIVAAQANLKTVDAGLRNELDGASASDEKSVSLVIHTAGPGVSLDGIPGLRIDTRSRNIITGVGNRQALDALADHPEVLSIERSDPIGTLECARSIPHVRATEVHRPPINEKGDGAIVAVIDSGVDVLHEAFRSASGATRILAFWDQTDARARAEDASVTSAVGESDATRALINQMGLRYGALYLADDIQRFIDGAPTPTGFPGPMDHGTRVCSIAAGRRTGDSTNDFAGGVAPEAALIAVRYDNRKASIGYSKGHIDAFNFVDRLVDVLDDQRPVVVNISNGMNRGAHDGTSTVENICEMFTGIGQRPGRIVVKSAGNERTRGRHATLRVSHQGEETLRWRSRNLPGESSTNPELFELWFSNAHEYEFVIRSPGGDETPPIHPGDSTFDELLGQDRVTASLTTYHPENSDASFSIKIDPEDRGEVQSGTWKLQIFGIRVIDEEPIHVWAEIVPNRRIEFLDYINDDVTVTIPGTAEHVIAVGAVKIGDRMRSFDRSSRGPSRSGRRKPELVAPGVELFGAQPGSGNGKSSKARSGTSFAAPHVAGAIALVQSARKKAGKAPLNAKQARELLGDTARHKPRSWHQATGWGELDVASFFDLAVGLP